MECFSIEMLHCPDRALNFVSSSAELNELDSIYYASTATKPTVFLAEVLLV